jgi:hypothetical protein
MILFLKGLAFGFLLAATVGPMWLLCFRRTIEQGPLAGFISGMGIAVAARVDWAFRLLIPVLALVHNDLRGKLQRAHKDAAAQPQNVNLLGADWARSDRLRAQ